MHQSPICDGLMPSDASGCSSIMGMPRWSGQPTATPRSIGGPFSTMGWCFADRPGTTLPTFLRGSYARRCAPRYRCT